MAKWVSDGWIGWTAGIIDGEGSVGIVHRKRHRGNSYWEAYEIRVTVSNTDLKMIEKLVDIWGGNFHIVQRNNPKWKDCYHYCCSSNQALNMLKSIYPFLITKKSKAGLAIELQQRIFSKIGLINNRMTTDERSFRHSLFSEMKGA